MFHDGIIRNVMVGDREIVRMIYIAVRDAVWNTIGQSISGLRIDSTGSSFQIEFDCRHKKRIVDFICHGIITGTSDSAIRFSMQGRALSSFQSNRIGFCVLHPLSECCGKPCTVMTIKGEKISGRFPPSGFISPGQPFKNIRAILQTADGIESRITFKGDTFEMEDQRNWTDASFKTYCPPLSRAHPFPVKKGDLISQSIEIAVSGKSMFLRRSPETTSKDFAFRMDSASENIPEIGCEVGKSPTAAGLRLVRLLGLSHVRIDADVSKPGVASALRLIDDILKGPKVPLELALHFSEEPFSNQILLMLDMLSALQLPVKRFLVFRHGETVTSGSTIRQVLSALRRSTPGADIVTGTDSYFVEINRHPPQLHGVNGICYSVNSQVHTFDDQSILDNLEGQFYTVRNARRLGRGLPVFVSPVTLRPRLNSDIPDKFHGPDVRQKSLLGAVWTLGSIIQLAKGGAAGATFFEFAGSCGVMEQNGGRVFPLFHVLADVNEFSGGTMRILSCNAHHARECVFGCMLEKDGKKRFLLANRTMDKKEIILAGVAGTYLKKMLDETTFHQACRQPGKFRKQRGAMVRPKAGCLTIKLKPYGIIRMDNLY